ncbi:hypothetical protein [Streptomyces sp. HNM0574]|uniref:hypothetical protein n=1 Tax=Streptomyces sp. HNM0574 TaxID=2714954 RepID=UPI00146D104D|nr:hypothetical protein [Streptomyces sp. HNM0574]NLU66436.1 hypothetical protein [Streptomyces sp. HNM0574]
MSAIRGAARPGGVESVRGEGGGDTGSPDGPARVPLPSALSRPAGIRLRPLPRPLLTTLGWTAATLTGLALLVGAFLQAWRHVRLTPALVDDWPGGAAGFGFCCAVAVLVGRLCVGHALRTGRRRALLPVGVLICLTGAVHGLAAVPPRWCHQSTSPRCGDLPGAAEAGLVFLGVLIAVFFLHGTFRSAVRRVRTALVRPRA